MNMSVKEKWREKLSESIESTKESSNTLKSYKKIIYKYTILFKSGVSLSGEATKIKMVQDDDGTLRKLELTPTNDEKDALLYLDPSSVAAILVEEK